MMNLRNIAESCPTYEMLPRCRFTICDLPSTRADKLIMRMAIYISFSNIIRVFALSTICRY